MKGAFYWSVRRELWEHRSVWATPLAVAAFVVVASFVAASGHVQKAGNLSALPPDKLQPIVLMPLTIAASVILLLSFIVSAFYCLDALNGERRDRSILFWKSMPVSDTITVLAKAFVPVVVAPAIAFVIAIVTQAALFIPMAGLFKAVGADLGAAVAGLPLGTMAVALLYGVIVHALWYAPVFALFLLVSVAARRPLLWVLVPAIVVQVLERIAFGTRYAGEFISYRLLGALGEAFVPGALNGPVTSLSQLDPARFLTGPGLWLGLVAAAAFLFAAIRLRRSKESLT
jgi:ABC-2 type transport system permease protein